ncbi:hypothetical protein GCM10009839_62770 [Catenulispora yoronensis]|uniref:Amidohydrolase 3 domain-containing protein n=1 Tax=Catenulispora yoronensis TaxID=450799 RepID=A0ABP5GKV6_9ACTN
MEHADLVFTGGAVITVDGADRIAEAVAVTGGLITAVGTAEEVGAAIGPDTRVVRLDGGAVLPGINDSHLHAAMLGAYWPAMWLDGMADGGFPVPRQLADRADRRAAIDLAADVLQPLGITSYTEPGLGPGARGQHGGACDDETLAAYVDAATAGELRARVTVLRLFGELDGLSTVADLVAGLDRSTGADDVDPRWLAVAGVKLFADGIPPMHSAWMSEPYLGGGHGTLMVEGDDDDARLAALRAMIGHAHRAGCQIGVHATGDRAVGETVRAMAEALAADADSAAGSDATAGSAAARRHYIIHGDAIGPDTLTTMAEHGIGVNAQPSIYTATPGMLEPAIGACRTDELLPLRSALDAGVPVCLSSDGPVTMPDWRRGVASAVLRTAEAGPVRGPDQRIAVTEALRAYTMSGARQDGAEDWKGSIEVGKVADLCVLAADPLTAPPEKIPEIEIRMTVLDGRVVFDREA